MILEGDCIQLMQTIEPASVHLVLTDPPYFLDKLDSGWNKEHIEEQKSKGKTIKSLPVGMKFDPAQGIKLQEFYSLVAAEIFRVLKPGAFFLSFSQPRLYHRMAIAIEQSGFEIRDQYVWRFTKKSQCKAFRLNHFIDRMNVSDDIKNQMLDSLENRKTPQLKPEFESIIVAQKPKDGTFLDNWLSYQTGLVELDKWGKKPTTVFTFEKPEKEKYNGHLTVKPIELCSKLIEIFSKPEQTVLDPFLGSGTTIISCLQTNRNGIGIEKNKEYVEIAKQRLKNMNEIEYVGKNDFVITDGQYLELVQTLKIEHETYLAQYNIALPKENTTKFLWLVFLRNHIRKFVHKDTISSFVSSKNSAAGKDQQVRHLSSDGFYVLNRNDTVPTLGVKVPSGYHLLFSMESPKPTFLHSALKIAGRLSAKSFHDLKIIYGMKCATCGCEEGKPHRYFPDTTVILQQGHMNPNEKLDLENTIPQCQLCNSYYSNKFHFDTYGRIKI